MGLRRLFGRGVRLRAKKARVLARGAAGGPRFFDQRIEKGLIPKLEGIVGSEFVHMDYGEAIQSIGALAGERRGGFERTLAYVTGLANVRDAIPS